MPDTKEMTDALYGWDAVSRENERLRGALTTISEMSLSDQPAAQDIDEATWMLRHIASMRRVAAKALAESQ